jgi:hypothetical protein
MVFTKGHKLSPELEKQRKENIKKTFTEKKNILPANKGRRGESIRFGYINRTSKSRFKRICLQTQINYGRTYWKIFN